MNLFFLYSLVAVFAFTVGLSTFAQTPGADTVAANVKVIDPEGEEKCDVPFVYEAASSLLEVQGEGRLEKNLRLAASKADPLFNLHKATLRYLEGAADFGNAYADLSVTGRRSFARFRQLHEAGAINEETILLSLSQDPLAKKFTKEQLWSASARAIARAYKVANVLPYGNSPERRGLGWIAVSGEDDSPYRPVNLPASQYPQYDLDVVVGQHKVQTRYAIYEALKVPPVPTPVNERTLPLPQLPELSKNAKVLISIGGMESRLEEVESVFAALQKIARVTGENWTIIAMDLPTMGYATMLDHRDVSPLSDLGKPRLLGFNARGTQRVPILDFTENFVVNFVDTLDQKLNFKKQIVAVMGGSLGGNLTFRLGRRTDLPWLKNVVTWSPASIWTGLADGHDIFKQLGVATAWKRAGGKQKNVEETLDQRGQYFSLVYAGAIKIGPFQVMPSQPEQWCRAEWECCKSSLKLSKIERHEIYNPKFRLWRWRVGAEQLIFSHQTPPDRTTPRYMDNHVRMLLACGQNDDFNFTNICSSTKKTAEQMTATPGRALIFANTGHSIQSERPTYLANEIVDFLRGK
ncbi:MAG: hypothetical protein A2X86_03115 [Bdellovibrionales bacterium GWA2_49_15]|nr:MAG: hypothetical protein A2X86_03115 [Bdellovibrionales bacterium GWA2_49_15]HAZ12204.1 hypothetical protein [Bdellovibrionales bacterium]